MPCSYCLSIAGITLQLQTEQTLELEEAFAPFLTEETTPDVRAEFVQAERLPPIPERTLYRDTGRQICEENGRILRFFYSSPDAAEPYAAAFCCEDGKHIRVQYLKSGSGCVSQLGNSFFHLDLEDILIRHGRLCFHAACVETKLGGILFSGPSGIGKSTQAELWCRHRGARQINGDRPALSRTEAGWLAWGSPYAGSSGVHVNDSCPVTAIVMLRQAKQCTLRRLSSREAFRAVWTGLALHSWDRCFMETASGLAMDLIGAVPVFEFSCTPDETAVAYLEQGLRKDKNL